MNLNRTQVGTYRILVFATDRNGVMSNQKEVAFVLFRNNSRPVIFGFPTIRQFSPSGTDSTLLTVSIAVADSDGLADIASASVRTLNAMDSSEHDLFDDGSPLHGDPFPGDGVFSSVFWTHPLSGVQNLELVFVAIDRRGATSDSVRRTLTNSPPRIVQLNVPDSIQRPSGPPQLIPFFLTAADSDGLGDIDSVFFTNLSSVNPTNFPLYDDGNLAVSGDSTRGDGIYSSIVQIDAATSLGAKNFQFNVKDKFGAKDSLRKIITIY